MKRNLHNSESFKDFLFILLLNFFVLLCLLLMLPKEINRAVDEKITKKAEFVISMTWDDHRDTDMDLWVLYQGGSNKPVSFNRKKVDHIFLEQDDCGLVTDQVVDQNGIQRQAYVNEEIVTIRAISPGHYVINGNVYYGDMNEPLEVTVKIVKLNPHKEVDKKTITFTSIDQERTFAIITIDENGIVTNISREQYNLVLKQKLDMTQ